MDQGISYKLYSFGRNFKATLCLFPHNFPRPFMVKIIWKGVRVLLERYYKYLVMYDEKEEARLQITNANFNFDSTFLKALFAGKQSADSTKRRIEWHQRQRRRRHDERQGSVERDDGESDARAWNVFQRGNNGRRSVATVEAFCHFKSVAISVSNYIRTSPPNNASRTTLKYWNQLF